jgi:DNA-binding NarL/FixJ family response regulator
VTITVVVTEDEALVRAGCVMLLNAAPGVEVLGQASNGVEVELVHSLRPTSC